MAEYDRAAIMPDVLEQIANGKSLRAICEPEGMPAPSTIVSWLQEDKALAEQYAHARERQADFYADEIIEIADAASDPAKARLQVDARKWKASKLAPKRYGDRVLNEHSGPGGAPITTVQRIERVVIDPANPDTA
jgi:hypothetical protein